MATGNQGGTSQQHAEAGKQSHKNAGGSTGSSGSKGTSHRGEVKDPKHDGRLKENR